MPIIMKDDNDEEVQGCDGKFNTENDMQNQNADQGMKLSGVIP